MRLWEARAACKLWQERLGLHEWRISVHRGKAVDHEPDVWLGEIMRDCHGMSTWHAEEARAAIVLSRGAGLDTLVHELLHIRLEGHTMRNRAYSEMYERGINALTEALLS